MKGRKERGRKEDQERKDKRVFGKEDGKGGAGTGPQRTLRSLPIVLCIPTSPLGGKSLVRWPGKGVGGLWDILGEFPGET